MNSLFKKSDSGATLFYPWGVIGKRYVVSSESEHSRIRSALKVYYVVMFLAMGISIYFLNWFYAAGCTILGIGGYLVWSSTVTRRLVVSAERLLIFREPCSEPSILQHMWFWWFLSLLSFIFVLMGRIHILHRTFRMADEFTLMCFFGATTVILVFMTINKAEKQTSLNWDRIYCH